MLERRLLTGILVVFVIAQFVMITYFNFTISYDLLDMDASLAMRHATEMWKHGLFLKDFAYVTSMEIDSATFFAAPLLLMTGNINIAMGIVHSFLYLFIIYLLYEISKNGYPSGNWNGFLLSVFFFGS